MGDTWVVEVYQAESDVLRAAWVTELRTEVLVEAIEEMGRLKAQGAGAIRLTWRPDHG